MIELTRSKRYLLSVFSGILLFISFPFTGSLFFLSFFAWVPLLIVESNIYNKNYKSFKVYIHAFITFFIYNLGSTWWIWNASAGGAVFAIVLNALIMALIFYIFHITRKKIKIKNSEIFFPIFWIAFEFIHYHWELSYPWLTIGNVFSIAPQIVQWYSYTGVLGGSLWVLLINLGIYNVFINYSAQKKINYRKLILIGAFLILPVTVSYWTYKTYIEKKNPTEIVVVQPNIDPYNEKFNSDLDQQLNKLFQQANRKVTNQTDFVVAPETAISTTFYEDEILQLSFYKKILNETEKWKRAYFFSGASTARFFERKNSIASRPISDGPGFQEFYNSSLLIDKPTNFPVFVHKSKLVLGVEKIPFSRWIPWLEELSINNGGTSGTLGIEKEPKIYQTRFLKFAPCICYESIYGSFIAEQCKKGSELIFVITNDGWWGDTPGYKQHLSFARLRAIENRRSIARSANTGTSCFINQRGDVFQSTAWWKADAIRGVLNKNSETTFYTRFGDLIGQFCAVLSLAFLFYAIFLKAKKLFS